MSSLLIMWPYTLYFIPTLQWKQNWWFSPGVSAVESISASQILVILSTENIKGIGGIFVQIYIFKI